MAARSRTLTLLTARRLAVDAQLLAGPRPGADRDSLLSVVKQLGCLQLDPVSAVARSHLLVLASRVGSFAPADVDALLYEERRLFEYWAHAASIVPTEDYAIHAEMMRRFRSRKRDAGGTGSVQRRRRLDFMAAYGPLRRHVLARLRAEGPLPARAFEGEVRKTSWAWSTERDVDRMLTFLWTEGHLVVAGRDSRGRIWGLAEEHFPPEVLRARLASREVVRRGAERAIRALGVATERDVREHFIRGRYPGLPGVLAALERRGRIVPVEIRDGTRKLPGRWLVHADAVERLDAIEGGAWEPRAALLSPFDNLVCDRRRTETLFGFHYRMEIYVPERLRKFGYYVMPLLHGESVVGRVDPFFDRRTGTLELRAVHAEAGAGTRSDVGEGAASAAAQLARFLGAKTIRVRGRLPAGWRRALASIQ